MKVKSSEIVLEAIETRDGVELAILKVDLVLEQSDPTLTLTMTLSGKMGMGVASGWPYFAKLSGPITMSGGQPAAGVTMDGSGETTLSGKWTYAKKEEPTKKE